MKIVIDIPEEFIGEWKRDRFSDSLLRMGVGADHEGLDLCGMLISVFEEAKEIPTPHGDLIDRDALKENGDIVNEDMGLYSYQGISIESINIARTIIKSEK